MANGRQGTGDLRIVMIGETGTGKSELGNSILLKENAFIAGVSSSSVTKVCLLQRENVLGTSISVVDTPGLFDTGMQNEEVIKEILRSLWMTAPGPHAFLLTLKIGGRFTSQVQNTIEMFKKFFNGNITDYMIVVFTHKDQLKGKHGRPTQTIEEYVNDITVPAVKDIIQKCGKRYIAFNNASEDLQERKNQVNSLIQMIKAMVGVNGGGHHYTNDLLKETEVKLNKRVQEVLAEEKATRLVEEEKIRKEYEGDLRDKMLADLLRKCNNDAEHRVRNESQNWYVVSVLMEKFIEKLPDLARMLMMYNLMVNDKC